MSVAAFPLQPYPLQRILDRASVSWLLLRGHSSLPLRNCCPWRQGVSTDASGCSKRDPPHRSESASHCNAPEYTKVRMSRYSFRPARCTRCPDFRPHPHFIFHIGTILSSCHLTSANHPFVLPAIFTSVNITGTSVKTPTVVASAAGLVVPNRAIATATASSKKFEAPIMPAGAAISNGSHAEQNPYCQIFLKKADSSLFFCFHSGHPFQLILQPFFSLIIGISLEQELC